MKVVVLLSGGLDSATALYDLKKAGNEVRALAFDYGQKHKREIEHAREIAQGLGVDFQVANISAIQNLISGSSQTSSEIDVPEGHYTEESMKLTVVPNRNMLFLSIGMAWAIRLRYDAVAYAAHSGDHTIYPDCRPEFVEAMQNVAQICDWHKIEIVAPYLQFTKTDIVKRGMELDVPFSKTWSCYKGGDLHCGKCGTCVERKEAFELAALKDPTRYLGD